LLCALALAALPARQVSAQTQVIPLPPCVRYHISTNTLDAYFGYAATAAAHFDVGPDNFFSPGVLFRNQPLDFEAGVHDSVFVTFFQVSASTPQVTWSVNGRFAVAKVGSRPCDPPQNYGEWNPATAYEQNVVVSLNGVLWYSPYNLVSSPNLNVQPGTNPAYWELFASGVGLQGDPGSPGAPGPPGQSVIGAAEPPDINCPNGGVRYTDITGIRFVCNGAPGPQGQPGNTSVFPSAQIYACPSSGTLTILDPNVTSTSLIVLLYVAGGVPPAVYQNPLLISSAPGQFTVSGVAGKPFRYAVIK